MRLRDYCLILGVAVGLALTVTLVVAGVGPRERVARMPVAAGDDEEQQEALEESDISSAERATVARTHAAYGATQDDLPFVDASRRREGRRREAEFLAQFLTLRTERGSEAFEREVREVLASDSEPQCRKVAALCALHAAGVPGTDGVLRAAVEDQADVSDGSSLSLPRSALRLLFERAPSGEDARRVLARLAFVSEASISDDLRRRASTSLAATLPGARRDEVVRLLRLETNPRQFESALEALARDPNFGADRPPVAALGGGPGKQ